LAELVDLCGGPVLTPERPERWDHVAIVVKVAIERTWFGDGDVDVGTALAVTDVDLAHCARCRGSDPRRSTDHDQPRDDQASTHASHKHPPSIAATRSLATISRSRQPESHRVTRGTRSGAAFRAGQAESPIGPARRRGGPVPGQRRLLASGLPTADRHDDEVVDEQNVERGRGARGYEWGKKVEDQV